MVSLNFDCDIKQGFNFQKGAQCLIGHLAEIKIGDGVAFAVDIAVTNPTTIDIAAEKVVGVISKIYWEGGHADPIWLGCRISTNNKVVATTLMHTNLSNTEVGLKFNIYDYDPEQKKFFTCFHTIGILKGLISKSGGELELGVNPKQEDDIASPKNYSFYIAVIPSEEEQVIGFAASTDANFSKKWGATITA